VAVPVVAGLAGNLATNTVRVEWRWWPVVVWVMVVVLVVAAVVVERARLRQHSGAVASSADPQASRPGAVASGPGAVAIGGDNRGIVSTGRDTDITDHR
jgi:hypothetical protein